MIQVSLIIQTPRGLTKIDYEKHSLATAKNHAKHELKRLGLSKFCRHTIWWKAAGMGDYAQTSLGDVELSLGREML
jgi:hypothetical protein